MCAHEGMARMTEGKRVSSESRVGHDRCKVRLCVCHKLVVWHVTSMQRWRFTVCLNDWLRVKAELQYNYWSNQHMCVPPPMSTFVTPVRELVQWAESFHDNAALCVM